MSSEVAQTGEKENLNFAWAPWEVAKMALKHPLPATNDVHTAHQLTHTLRRSHAGRLDVKAVDHSELLANLRFCDQALLFAKARLFA